MSAALAPDRGESAHPRWVPWGLAGLVALLFREVLAGGVLYRRDIHLVWHSQVEAFVRAVAEGSWPVWDPAPAFGQPLLADPSAMVLYPFTWLNLLLRPWTYYSVFAVSHVFFSGYGMSLLARRLGMTSGASFLAGALWLTCGPFVSLIDLWHHFAGAVWMPWVVLAAIAALEAPSRRSIAAFGGAAGLQILCGSADMVSLTGVAVLSRIAVFHLRWRRGEWATNRRQLAVTALAGVIALGLSAGLWMAAADVARTSARWSLPASVRTYWSLHPVALAETLSPGLFSALPLQEPLRASLFESREPFLASIYLGNAAFALVGWALLAAPRRLSLLLLGLTSFATAVAFGHHTPAYDVATWLVPPIAILRYPVKTMVLAALCWCLLAGTGWDAWRRDGTTPSGWRRRVLLALPLGVTLLAAAAWVLVRWQADAVGARLVSPGGLSYEAILRPTTVKLLVQAVVGAATLALTASRFRGAPGRATAAIVGALAVGELTLYHRHPNPVAPRELYTHRPALVDDLKATKEVRAYVYDYTRPDKSRQYLGTSPGLRSAPAGWSHDAASSLAMQMSLTPATAGRWDIDTGFDIDYRGLYAVELERLCTLLRLMEGTPAHDALLRLGGVTHVVSRHDAGFEHLQPVKRYDSLYAQDVRLYAVPKPLPRAFAVPRARSVDERGAVEAVLDPTFDPRTEVLLDRDITVSPMAAGKTFRGFCRIRERHADRVVVDAELTEPGFVVLLDGYSSGWEATIDGVPAPVYRANIAFRAVPVPAGGHRVTLTYRPVALRAGLTLSALTALVVIGLLTTRGRREPGEES